MGAIALATAAGARPPAAWKHPKDLKPERSHPSRYANRAESRFEFLPRPGTLLLALVIFYGIRCAYVFVTLTIAPWPLTQQRESGE